MAEVYSIIWLAFALCKRTQTGAIRSAACHTRRRTTQTTAE